MGIKDYQKSIKRTMKDDMEESILRVEMALGVNTEAGELGELIKKEFFHNKPVDRDELMSEMGDVMWYLGNLANLFNISLDEVMHRNVDKLFKRYPNGYTPKGGIR